MNEVWASIMPYIIIIILLVISIIILITIIITNKRIEKSNSALDEDIFRKEVNLINDKIIELNEHYNFISEQLDAKQKELLFLYQMISLKEEELGVDETDIKKEFSEEVMEKKVSEFNERVVTLHKEGYEVEEIAKKLGRGKGEVALAVKIYC